MDVVQGQNVPSHSGYGAEHWYPELESVVADNPSEPLMVPTLDERTAASGLGGFDATGDDMVWHDGLGGAGNTPPDPSDYLKSLCPLCGVLPCAMVVQGSPCCLRCAETRFGLKTAAVSAVAAPPTPPIKRTAAVASPDHRAASRGLSDTMEHTASWWDVQAKAKRIWREGGVKFLELPTDTNPYLFAEVQGDHGTYHVLAEKRASKWGPWTCECRWGNFSKWGPDGYRRALSSPYLTRRCSHGLGAIYAYQSQTMFGRTPRVGAQSTGDRLPRRRESALVSRADFYEIGSGYGHDSHLRSSGALDRRGDPGASGHSNGGVDHCAAERGSQGDDLSTGFLYPLEFHPKVPKDLKRLPEGVQQNFDNRVDDLRRGIQHPSTHPLDGDLRGWMGTSIGGRKYRMVHKYENESLRIHSVGTHEPSYKNGGRRQAVLAPTTAPEPSWLDREPHVGKDGAPHSGCMVALPIPEHIGVALAEQFPEGEDPRDMHCTVVYLGKSDEVDPQALHQAVASTAHLAPKEASIGGYGTFEIDPKENDGYSYVHIGLVDAPGLDEYRAALIEALEAHGIHHNTEHGYQPHVSLEYAHEPLEGAVEGSGQPFGIEAVVGAHSGHWRHYPVGGMSHIATSGGWHNSDGWSPGASAEEMASHLLTDHGYPERGLASGRDGLPSDADELDQEHAEDHDLHGECGAHDVEEILAERRHRAVQNHFNPAEGMEREAALDDDPDHLRNPADGSHEWHHGTPRKFGSFDDEPEEDDEDWDGGYDPNDNPHWNTHLGQHWTSLRESANKFARGMSWSKDRIQNSGHDLDGDVVTAKLGIKHPKVYSDEPQMDAEAFEHHWRPHDDAADPDNVHWNHCRDDHCEGLWNHEPGDPVEKAVKAHYAHPGNAEHWLRVHPESADMAGSFRHHLISQGHDGIVYGNSSYEEGPGPERHKCAITFDTSQIHEPRRRNWREAQLQ